jgi:hypothetical protein
MLSDKKYIYANGTSVTAGGGFEPYEYRNDVRDAYKSCKDNELPDSQIECTYPYFLKKQIGNIELINDAKCGSGIERLVRTSMDWIENNQDKLNETIFIFEAQFGIRLDWYVNEWQDFGILNAAKNMKGEYPFNLVKTWYIDDMAEQIGWNEKYKDAIDSYMNNFFDGDLQFKKEINLLILFVSYLNQLNLDYYISLPSSLDSIFKIKDLFNKLIPHRKNLSLCFNTDIWNYCKLNKLLISDEVDDGDNHIGYYGAQKVAFMIYDFINNPKYNKTFNVFCIGKSYNNPAFKSEPRFQMFFKYKNIKIQKTIDENNSDFCVIEDANPYVLKFENGVDLLKTELEKVKIILDENPKLYKKNFFLTITHEKITEKEFKTFVDMWVDIVGVSKQQLFLVDCLLTNYMGSNNIPLEFKIKAFAFKPTHEQINFSKRNFKFTYLNGGLDENRMFVLDSVLFNYGDIEKLKIENKISLIDTKNFSRLYLSLNHYLKSNLDDFKKLQMPLFVDSDRTDVGFSFDYPDLQNIMSLYLDSVFSIVNDTHSYDKFFYRNNFDDWAIKTSIQFSEKVLMAIYAENLTFPIVDGSYYSEFEKIGFDFSYLKEIFDIDYSTNNHFENFQCVEKFVNFVKDKSVIELNKIRFNYRDLILKNKQNLLDLFYSDEFTTNEKIFLKKLSGKFI